MRYILPGSATFAHYTTWTEYIHQILEKSPVDAVHLPVLVSYHKDVEISCRSGRDSMQFSQLKASVTYEQRGDSGGEYLWPGGWQFRAHRV